MDLRSLIFYSFPRQSLNPPPQSVNHTVNFNCQLNHDCVVIKLYLMSLRSSWSRYYDNYIAWSITIICCNTSYWWYPVSWQNINTSTTDPFSGLRFIRRWRLQDLVKLKFMKVQCAIVHFWRSNQALKLGWILGTQLPGDSSFFIKLHIAWPRV